ncbi:MAG: hypothetical protein JKY43_10965 [Phycisphaerales bacterium]|nr:hypothetical protein [Phycisphaerales bacterium]
MAFTKNKIWVKNNYLFLRLTTGELLSDHKSDVEITPTTPAENEYLITSNKIGSYTLKVADIVDINDVQFTPVTFSDFYTDNSGFNPDAGGSASIPLTEKGAPNGVATLDSGGQVPLAQIPASIKGGIKVVGFWDASTNTPNLSLLSLNQGEAYIVSVPGSTNLNGETNWKAKDLVVWDDSLTGNWFKIDNTDDVLSVSGKTGVIILDSLDITDFQAAVSSNSSVALNTSKVTNATHTGDVTGSGALTIVNKAVTNAKLADLPANTIKSNNTGAVSGPVDMSISSSQIVARLATGNLKGCTVAEIRDLLGIKWFMNQLSLDAVLINLATRGLSAGAGSYIIFDPSSDDEIRVNIGLFNNGLSYDGSDIALQLNWMKFGNSGGTVIWDLEYAFIEIGDNSYSKLDGTLTESVDVTAIADQILTETLFPVISGVAGSKILQLTLTRNSTGLGSDTYSGDAELYGFNFI